MKMIRRYQSKRSFDLVIMTMSSFSGSLPSIVMKKRIRENLFKYCLSETMRRTSDKINILQLFILHWLNQSILVDERRAGREAKEKKKRKYYSSSLIEKLDRSSIEWMWALVEEIDLIEMISRRRSSSLDREPFLPPGLIISLQSIKRKIDLDCFPRGDQHHRLCTTLDECFESSSTRRDPTSRECREQKTLAKGYF